jgi:hypothetical protein
MQRRADIGSALLVRVARSAEQRSGEQRHARMGTPAWARPGMGRGIVLAMTRWYGPRGRSIVRVDAESFGPGALRFAAAQPRDGEVFAEASQGLAPSLVPMAPCAYHAHGGER